MDALLHELLGFIFFINLIGLPLIGYWWHCANQIERYEQELEREVCYER